MVVLDWLDAKAHRWQRLCAFFPSRKSNIAVLLYELEDLEERPHVLGSQIGKCRAEKCCGAKIFM